jgi:hypothetical protein
MPVQHWKSKMVSPLNMLAFRDEHVMGLDQSIEQAK